MAVSLLLRSLIILLGHKFKIIHDIMMTVFSKHSCDLIMTGIDGHSHLNQKANWKVALVIR